MKTVTKPRQFEAYNLTVFGSHECLCTCECGWQLMVEKLLDIDEAGREYYDESAHKKAVDREFSIHNAECHGGAAPTGHVAVPAYDPVWLYVHTLYVGEDITPTPEQFGNSLWDCVQDKREWTQTKRRFFSNNYSSSGLFVLHEGEVFRVSFFPDYERGKKFYCVKITE